MLKKLMFAAVGGVLLSAGALVPAHASADPGITPSPICSGFGLCWNDAGNGYLQVVNLTESEYTNVNQGSWAGHTTYEWKLNGTNSCLTFQNGLPGPYHNDFHLATCTAGKDYQAFWFDGQGQYLISEGASTPGVNWGVCAGDKVGDVVYASSIFKEKLNCQWTMN